MPAKLLARRGVFSRHGPVGQVYGVVVTGMWVKIADWYSKNG